MLSQEKVCSGMSGRVENVVTGGSRAFKVKERQQQALGHVGLTDASRFLELGQKRVDGVPAPLAAYLTQTCDNAAHFKTQSGHHPPTFARIGPGDQMPGTCLFPWLSCALGLPSRGFLIHLLFGFSEGTQMGPVPARMVKGLIRSFDPAPFP